MLVGEVLGICTAGVCMFVGEVSGSCTACVCMCIYTGTVRPCTAGRLCLACTHQPSAASSSAAPTAAHARTSRRGVRSAHTRRSRTRGAKLISARRANVAAPPRHCARPVWIYATRWQARNYARPCTAVRGSWNCYWSLYIHNIKQITKHFLLSVQHGVCEWSPPGFTRKLRQV